MAKNGKTAAVKGRETKLNKKNSDELIQIILKKDKVERNLNNQIKSLKGEVNILTERVKNFDKDMEGTIQSLDTYKDRCNALQEKNDRLISDCADVKALFIKESKKTITLKKKIGVWKVATCVMTVVALIAIIVAVL